MIGDRQIVYTMVCHMQFLPCAHFIPYRDYNLAICLYLLTIEQSVLDMTALKLVFRKVLALLEGTKFAGEGTDRSSGWRWAGMIPIFDYFWAGISASNWKKLGKHALWRS